MIAYSKTQYLWPFLLWHKKRPPNQANLSSRNILFFLKHFHRTGGNIFRNPILPFQQKAACGNTVPRKRRHWPRPPQPSQSAGWASCARPPPHTALPCRWRSLHPPARILPRRMSPVPAPAGCPRVLRIRVLLSEQSVRQFGRKKVPGRLWAPVGLRESCGAWDLLWLARSRGFAGQVRKDALERKVGMLGNGGMPTIYTVAYWNHSHILWADVISR